MGTSGAKTTFENGCSCTPRPSTWGSRRGTVTDSALYAPCKAWPPRKPRSLFKLPPPFRDLSEGNAGTGCTLPTLAARCVSLPGSVYPAAGRVRPTPGTPADMQTNPACISERDQHGRSEERWAILGPIGLGKTHSPDRNPHPSPGCHFPRAGIFNINNVDTTTNNINTGNNTNNLEQRSTVLCRGRCSRSQAGHSSQRHQTHGLAGLL